MAQVARDVYGVHVLDLSAVQLRRVPTFIAMIELESEAIDAITQTT